MELLFIIIMFCVVVVVAVVAGQVSCVFGEMSNTGFSVSFWLARCVMGAMIIMSLSIINFNSTLNNNGVNQL